MTMDIDALYEQFQIKENALADVLSLCEAEQAAGRSGVGALREANRLHEELKFVAGLLAELIDDALAEIGAKPPPSST
ncbi:hypothetical protein [Sphingopyxis granuli]|uniref:hypothetical protein n=1 Tax=Sphingopyxis granuli TaxID=267128 RepID=UPI0008332910|nr:hypothetical protein [Sphingopyxis granuli]